MKKKTMFRMMIITSAFALLTLPTMNAGRAIAAPAPARDNCLGEFLGCLANTGGDPMCLETFLECIGSRK